MITTQLFLTLVANGVAGFAMIGASLFVLMHNWRKPVNIFFFGMVFPIGIFHLILILTQFAQTAETAYFLWMFNLTNLIIAVSAPQFILHSINRAKEYKLYIIALYVIAAAIFSLSLLFPHLFLTGVAPKLYFTWYLEGGPLYIAMLLLFVIGPAIPFIHMVFRYFQGFNKLNLEYIILILIVGYGSGVLNFPLVFDFPLNPVYGSLISLAMLVLAYGIIADDLLDIRIIAKRALVYSLGIGGSVAAVALLIFLNDFLVSSVPWVQFWTIPVFAGLITFVIGRLFWSQSVEADRLKYEFITVATHKLRTPLTQIGWGLKILEEEKLSPDGTKTFKQVEHAHQRLIELTNLLFATAEGKSQEAKYTSGPIDLTTLTQGVINELKDSATQKNIVIDFTAAKSVPIMGDTRRIRSVIEVFLENAIAYSSEKSTITIDVSTKKHRTHFSITDQGIGVDSKEQSRIFTKFYRTDAAKKIDTEGVGLGLTTSKDIIRVHKGKIGVDSEGEGKGSTFWFWVRTK